MPPLAALILDWVMTACWPIIGASGMAYFSGLLFTTAGLLLGVVALSPWLAARGRWKTLLDRRTGPAMLGMGFFSGAATAIFISALRYTTPANAAIMAQVEVLYSALLCAFFLGESITQAQAAASALVIAGTGLIMLHDLSSPRWKGDLMILATPWMFQVSHMLSKRLPAELDSLSLAGGRAVYGIVAMAPFCWYSLRHGGRWSWRPQALQVLAVQGLLMSSINFVVWYRAIRNMDLSKATAFILSYPALTLFFSWALGRERVSGTQVLGLLVTLAGATWMSLLVLRAQDARQPRFLPETPGTDLVP
ncbi:MAG: DMT family transporter [Elusimicrobia bacterium]|nr:DMT family transporter [Elusimicrobiota bacterium]MDE2236971.1 DMT family transporter [Elusimicrobiota bacterium]MDE2425149.1 DMT family transporter [Elusimicrobiota bacterium]